MRSVTSIVAAIILASAPFARGAESSFGKAPDWADPATVDQAPPVVSAAKSVIDPATEVSLPLENPTGPPPKPFTSLANAVDFILNQRGLNGKGLPATFYVPASAIIPDPLRRLIIREGVGLYDTSLAVIALIDAGRLIEARDILKIYVDGSYNVNSPAPMELRVFPSVENHNAFAPFDEDVHYFFDFTNVYGDWSRWGDGWTFWSTHTGPNAWLANAAGRYIVAARAQGYSETELAPYVALADSLGQAMRRLQDPAALGGVRYGPKDSYHDPDLAAPFDEINSENNVSAYAAFQILYRVTQNPQYQQSAHLILLWFLNAQVWGSDGQPRRGLFNLADGTLAMGAVRTNNRWVVQDDHPTDSAGTWTISVFGPEKIDRLWGRGTAYRMWQAVRTRAGRSYTFGFMHPGQALAGLDYNDVFPASESLISPEWSAGGLYALRALIDYYGNGAGRGAISEAQVQELGVDLRTMTFFLRHWPNAYALGPGHYGSRQGRTGFHWFCPPPDVDAMASIYFALFVDGQIDPQGWWRLAKPEIRRPSVSEKIAGR